jgi:hypothetical protein
MPVPKVPLQGDAARIEQLSSGLKREHGTHGAVVQRNDVGRPSTGQQAQAQPMGKAQMVPPEHQQMFNDVAEAEWVRQFWEAYAARFPGTLAEMYRAEAEANVRRVAEGVYQKTPNFEW